MEPVDVIRCALLACTLTACTGSDNEAEKDLGPIEDVVDNIARTVWPGVVDSDGQRFVRRINGFFDGEPTAYWFSGFAPRFTADEFWFCRDTDASCPIDDDGRVDPGRTLGAPVFSRIPGEQGYSPYWRIRVVRVGDDYQPDDIKSVLGIETAEAAGRVHVDSLRIDYPDGPGGAEVLSHCLLVLDGTQLEGNGSDIVGKPGVPSRIVPLARGWHKQYRVRFYDFIPSEGVFPPDPKSSTTPRMPSANIFVLFRDCEAGSSAAICGLTSATLTSVSERGVETDLTGDGDKADTNNVVPSFPGRAPANPDDGAYSALWRVQVVTVNPERDADVALIDTSGAQDVSDIRDVDTLRARIALGDLRDPEPMSEAQAGDSIAGNDGEVFFNCPAQVPQ